MSADDQLVVVIGSGPAGAMAAWKLVRRGIRVTMLESGDQYPRGMLVRVNGTTVYSRMPQVPRYEHHLSTGAEPVKWVRSLEPGGLSNYWAGISPRFSPDDFVEGARLHEKYRWPIEYQDLAPYYGEAERVMDVIAGARSVAALPAPSVGRYAAPPPDWTHLAQTAELHGQSVVPMPMAGGKRWWFKEGGTLFDSFSGIVRSLERSPLFTLVRGAHALRLEWSGQKKKAVAVVFHDRKLERERRVVAKAFVVAAGALASTKLLLDSACSDFPNGLGNQAGVLGRYLHDHPVSAYELRLGRPIAALPYSMYLTRLRYADSEPLVGAGCVMMSARNALYKIGSLVGKKSDWIGGGIFGSIVPTEERRVRLHGSEKDEFGQPKLEIFLSYTESEKRTLVTAVERMARILDAAGFECRGLADNPRAQPPGSAVHFGGTVRMHASPEFGMLDRWNRLHAVPNVVVPDASSFTTSAEKNPTLTVMALASRAAEKLAVDLKTA